MTGQEVVSLLSESHRMMERDSFAVKVEPGLLPHDGNPQAALTNDEWRERAAHIERLGLSVIRASLMVDALQRIANETCDHGPGMCPRDIARAALSGEVAS